MIAWVGWVAYPLENPPGKLCKGVVGLAQEARETQARNDDES